MKKILPVIAIMFLTACAHYGQPQVTHGYERPCKIKCHDCGDCTECKKCAYKHGGEHHDRAGSDAAPKMEKCPMHK